MESLRQKGVRLIGISDGVDTSNGDDDLTPFRNIIAEMYARDTSRKVKAVLRAKGKDGKHLTNAAVYGYRKESENKNQWIIDPESAIVVRRVFQMTIGGKGPYQIARTFTDEKILRPSAYIAVRDGYDIPEPEDKYNWGGQSVKNILDRPEYMGFTVNFRTYKDSYKDRDTKKRPKEEWAVFENTQEPILDAATWESAQKCRVVRRRRNSTGEPNPLTGHIYCGECGGRMYNHMGTMAGIYDSQDSYACTQYTKYPPKCTMHYIKTSVLRTLILDAVKRVSGFVRGNQEEFVRLVREASEIQSVEAAKSQKKELAKSQKRCSELNALIKGLYEDKINGSLSPKRFEILSKEYEAEQESLEQRITELQGGLEQFNEEGQKAGKFIEVVSRYTDFSELTPAMLNEFVDKVYVHEADNSSGRRLQKVEIFLNFIGQFDVPGDGLDAEPELFDPIKHKRAKWRDYYYLHRESILAEKATATQEKRAAKLAAAPVPTAEEIEAEKKARHEKHKAYQREYQRKWNQRRREREKPKDGQETAI